MKGLVGVYDKRYAFRIHFKLMLYQGTRPNKHDEACCVRSYPS